MYEIPVDYIFQDGERERLTTRLLGIAANPYRDYERFQAEIRSLISQAGVVPESFVNLCNARQKVDEYENPYVLLRNCPVDPNLPSLDFDDPVNDKHCKKYTFVAEGFLVLYSVLMRQEPIGYRNINKGDIFGDIHPMRAMAASQSQKSNRALYFHKDLATHFVRPDWVNILGLRASAQNQIVTCFVRNKDLIEYLSPEILAELRKPQFVTPSDDILHASGTRPPTTSRHSVLDGPHGHDVRFFEKRTAGVDARAQESIDEMLRALNLLKKRLLLIGGDFIGSANDECIHNREIVHVADQDAVNNRWLLKIVTVRSLETYKAVMAENEVRIING